MDRAEVRQLYVHFHVEEESSVMARGTEIISWNYFQCIKGRAGMFPLERPVYWAGRVNKLSAQCAITMVVRRAKADGSSHSANICLF